MLGSRASAHRQTHAHTDRQTHTQTDTYVCVYIYICVCEVPDGGNVIANVVDNNR